MTLKPKLYGLVGFPIKHSLSPCMHNAAFSALKINARYTNLFKMYAVMVQFERITVIEYLQVLHPSLLS